VFHQASEIIARIKLDNKHKTILQQKLQKFIDSFHKTAFGKNNDEVIGIVNAVIASIQRENPSPINIKKNNTTYTSLSLLSLSLQVPLILLSQCFCLVQNITVRT
jgi:hypothetical protein